MALVLPFIMLAAVTSVLARRWGWRNGSLMAYVALVLLWWATAEVLSPFRVFGPLGVGAAYVLVASVAVADAVRHPPHRPDLRPWLRSVWIWVLLAEFALLLLLAVNVAPNTVDSMAYHLPKVQHWIQDGTVGPFKTAYEPQIYLPYLAEIGMAHMSMLGGTVWAVNLVQLTAHGATLVGVSALARNCGLDRRGQAIAAACIGLAPIAVSEAVTTQTDYVAASLVIAAFVAASQHRVTPPHWGWLLLTATASGLAVSTKPTAALVLLPAALWAIPHLRGLGPVRVAGAVVGGVLAAVLVNLSWILDNVAVFDSPLRPDNETVNGRITPGIVVGNLIRNTGTLLGTPYSGMNKRLSAVLADAMSALGVDPHEPDALLGSPVYAVITSRTEDNPPNALHGLLILAALVVLVVYGRRHDHYRRLRPVVLAVVVGLVLYAVQLRWQVWSIRLFLPLIALGAVLVAAWVVRWPRWLAGTLLVGLVAQSAPWLVLQEYRPLLGSSSVLTTSPEDELFIGNPTLRKNFVRVARETTRVPGARVGFGADMFEWEYPMWYLLQREDPTVVIGNVDGTGPDRPGGPWDRELRMFEIRAMPAEGP